MQSVVNKLIESEIRKIRIKNSIGDVYCFVLAFNDRWPFTEEWETRKKKEIVTTRQIETRVKRQVVLEDGEVVEDSGPLVTTNTTEDVEQQEHTTQEVRILCSLPSLIFCTYFFEAELTEFSCCYIIKLIFVESFYPSETVIK